MTFFKCFLTMFSFMSSFFALVHNNPSFIKYDFLYSFVYTSVICDVFGVDIWYLNASC